MEKINVAELLKDCPKGMELDCTMYEGVTLISVLDGLAYPIRIETPDGLCLLNEYGCYSRNEHAKCVIFPKGKTTWEGFQRPFKDGDVVVTTLGNIAIIKEPIGTDYLVHVILFNDDMSFYDTTTKVCVARFATEEEKLKLFKAIKEIGRKWNEETKTLDELVQSKFDITALKPFDRVLARCSSLEKWRIQFFEKYDRDYKHPFICMGCNKYKQCIPYKGNEHLLDKVYNCDDYYKTWE